MPIFPTLAHHHDQVITLGDLDLGYPISLARASLRLLRDTSLLHPQTPLAPDGPGPRAVAGISNKPRRQIIRKVAREVPKTAAAGSPLVWPPTTRPSIRPKNLGCEPCPQRGYQTHPHPPVPPQPTLGSTGRALQTSLHTAPPVHSRVQLLSTRPYPLGRQTRPHTKNPPAYPLRSASDLIAPSGILDAHIARASPVVRPLADLQSPAALFLWLPATSNRASQNGKRGGFRSPVKFLGSFLASRCCESRDRRLDWPAAPLRPVQRHIYLGSSLKPQPPVSSRTSRSQAWLHFAVDHLKTSVAS